MHWCHVVGRRAETDVCSVSCRPPPAWDHLEVGATHSGHRNRPVAPAAVSATAAASLRDAILTAFSDTASSISYTQSLSTTAGQKERGSSTSGPLRSSGRLVNPRPGGRGHCRWPDGIGCRDDRLGGGRARQSRPVNPPRASLGDSSRPPASADLLWLNAQTNLPIQASIDKGDVPRADDSFVTTYAS